MYKCIKKNCNFVIRCQNSAKSNSLEPWGCDLRYGMDWNNLVAHLNFWAEWKALCEKSYSLFIIKNLLIIIAVLFIHQNPLLIILFDAVMLEICIIDCWFLIVMFVKFRWTLLSLNMKYRLLNLDKWKKNLLFIVRVIEMVLN